MTKYARDYINSRIDSIKALHITPEHKLEKLNMIEKTLCALAQGKITEEEALYLIA